MRPLPHPSARALQAWFDGEGDVRQRAVVEAHADGCVQCRQRVETWRVLRSSVLATVPTPERFAGEGALWARLVPQLRRRSPVTWSWLSLLPPVIFVSVGTLLNLAIGLAVLGRALLGMGAIAPVGPWLGARLQALVSSAETDSLLSASLGTWLHQVLVDALQGWNRLGATTQDAVLFVIAVASLGLALIGVVSLYGWWAACWARRNSVERSIRAWSTAS